MDNYHRYIAAQSERNPRIQNLLTFMRDDTRERSLCRIVSLDFSSEVSSPTVHNVDRGNIDRLLTPASRIDPKFLGRIIIVEDLTKSVIESLGSKLQIDPLFFASHLPSPWPDVSFQTPDMVHLPSRLNTETSLAVHYYRTIQFEDPEIQLRKPLRTCNIHRKVVVLPKSKKVRIGLAKHSCSIFKTLLSDKTWICVILVDPPIGSTYYSLNHQQKGVPHHNVRSTLFLGGYQDFLEPPSMTDSSRYLPGPTRAGMLEDLIYYWMRHQPEFFDQKSPSLRQLAFYPLRIVASEWVTYLAAMHHSIKQYEYTVEDLPAVFREINRLNSDLKFLQSWRRRSMSSQKKMRSISHFIRNCRTTGEQSGSWELLAQDYDQLASKVDEFGQRFEKMLPVVTSMVQIADSRRSFAETANVSRLTYLALVFVPLTFTTGLFSMNDNTAPGSPGFWIFFAVAIPVTAAVFLAARPPVNETRQIWEFTSRRWMEGLKSYWRSPSNEFHSVELGECRQLSSSFLAGRENAALDMRDTRNHSEE